MADREPSVDVWSEVLSENLGATFIWDGSELTSVAWPIGEGVQMTEETMESLHDYTKDKEHDLLMQQEQERAGFDGTPQEFAEAYIEGEV